MKCEKRLRDAKLYRSETSLQATQTELSLDAFKEIKNLANRQHGSEREGDTASEITSILRHRNVISISFKVTILLYAQNVSHTSFEYGSFIGGKSRFTLNHTKLSTETILSWATTVQTANAEGQIHFGL